MSSTDSNSQYNPIKTESSEQTSINSPQGKHPDHCCAALSDPPLPSENNPSCFPFTESDDSQGFVCHFSPLGLVLSNVASSVCTRKRLLSPEFLGQYGTITYLSIRPMGPSYPKYTRDSSKGPSGAVSEVCVSFAEPFSTQLAYLGLESFSFRGHSIRATLQEVDPSTPLLLGSEPSFEALAAEENFFYPTIKSLTKSTPNISQSQTGSPTTRTSEISAKGGAVEPLVWQSSEPIEAFYSKYRLGCYLSLFSRMLDIRQKLDCSNRNTAFPNLAWIFNGIQNALGPHTTFDRVIFDDPPEAEFELVTSDSLGSGSKALESSGLGGEAGLGLGGLQPPKPKPVIYYSKEGGNSQQSRHAEAVRLGRKCRCTDCILERFKQKKSSTLDTRDEDSQ